MNKPSAKSALRRLVTLGLACLVLFGPLAGGSLAEPAPSLKGLSRPVPSREGRPDLRRPSKAVDASEGAGLSERRPGAVRKAADLTGRIVVSRDWQGYDRLENGCTVRLEDLPGGLVWYRFEVENLEHHWVQFQAVRAWALGENRGSATDNVVLTEGRHSDVLPGVDGVYMRSARPGSGTNQLLLVVDPGNQVPETNEGNNTARFTFYVVP